MRTCTGTRTVVNGDPAGRERTLLLDVEARIAHARPRALIKQPARGGAIILRHESSPTLLFTALAPPYFLKSSLRLLLVCG
jgi:hypothetical protein